MLSDRPGAEGSAAATTAVEDERCCAWAHCGRPRRDTRLRAVSDVAATVFVGLVCEPCAVRIRRDSFLICEDLG